MQQLVRRFSPMNMLFISINGMIGSAWLFAPMYAAKIAGPATIIAWLLGGGATILIALTYAEVSTMLPTAGGSTRIPQLSHGELVSFIMGWVSWLASVTMPPIEVQAVLQYASTYFPSLTHLVNNVPVLTAFGFLWATILMAALCILNVASFKGLIRVNQVLFTFKVLVMAFTILFFMKTSFHTSNFADMAATPTSYIGWQAILTAVATGGIAFAFTGFKHGVELAGEAKRSQFTVPFAIIGSVIGCLILYLGLQVAFIGALHPDFLKHGWNALDFAGDAGPFVGIAGILGLVWLVKLLYVDAAVSPMGAAFIYVTSTSRLIYALSSNGYLAKIFSRVNKESLPMWAIAFNFVIGMFLFLPLPGWQNMVSFLVSAVVISYAMAPIALLSFRRLVPNEKRAFRLPASNLLCFLAFYCCNLMSYWTGWDTIYKLAIALGIGLVLFFFSCVRKSNSNSLGLKASLWMMPYLLGLVVISHFGSFGGKNIIPFGWDFLVIGIFSFVMLYLAVAVRLNKIPAQFDAYKNTDLVASS
jgi:amino acid transporter